MAEKCFFPVRWHLAFLASHYQSFAASGHAKSALPALHCDDTLGATVHIVPHHHRADRCKNFAWAGKELEQVLQLA
jgi:hypothetical protein